MAESRYGKYICTEITPETRARHEIVAQNSERMEHVIWMDDDVIPGAPYSELVWFRPTADMPSPEEMRQRPGVPTHSHPFDEVLCYTGADIDNPHDLGGEIELWLEDTRFNLTESFLAYIPAGMKHCPLKHISIDKPIIHFTMGPGKEYTRQQAQQERSFAGEDVSKYVITSLKKGITEAPWSPGVPPIGTEGRGGRLFYIDSEVAPGAFYVEVVWVPPDEDRHRNDETAPHKHDFDEIIVLMGSDPNNIRDLGAEVELWLEDEKHIITQSGMVFVPAGMQHCPLKFNRVDRPIFHFTAGPGKMYL